METPQPSVRLTTEPHLRGTGELFLSPDVESARQAFRVKSKRLTDKVMPVADAVRRFVRDGDYLASG